MSTRSNIIVVLKPEDKGKTLTFDGSKIAGYPKHIPARNTPQPIVIPDNANFIKIYCHHDGYPDGVGLSLLTAFNTYESALNLALGGATSWISGNGESEYYHTWENESWAANTPYIGLANEAPFGNQPYAYKFEDGQWSVIGYVYDDWTPLSSIFGNGTFASYIHKELVQWIKDWFEENGKGCNAVIGLSGGKDSTIVAALCAEALGKDRVIGVGMPEHNQGINDADKIAEYLGIKYYTVPIGGIMDAFSNIQNGLPFTWSKQTEQNIPPRVRMAMLYAVSQTFNGRPSCNCNYSEDYIGYATFGGDDLAAFAPLSFLTVTEILALGDEMGLPGEWVHKTPDDGLPHSQSDEAKFGFTYKVLDRYIRTGQCDDPEIKEKIDSMHLKNLFKTEIIKVPAYEFKPSNLKGNLLKDYCRLYKYVHE